LKIPKRRKKSLLLFFLLLLFIFTPWQTAKSQVSFSVEPSTVRAVLPSGGAKSGILKVLTRSPRKIRIKVYGGDWKYSDVQNGIRAYLPPKSTSLSCLDWITFSPAETVIAPYGVGQINYTINAPAGAQGSRYAVLFIETSMFDESKVSAYQTEVAKQTVTLNLRLAVLFCVEVKNTIKRAIDLAKFTVAKSKNKNAILIASDLKNVGNADIKVSGAFHIMGQDGKIYARGKFNDIYTLPGDSGKINAGWKEILPKGNYNLVITLSLGKTTEEEASSRTPVITREAEIEIGDNGEVIKLGEFK